MKPNVIKFKISGIIIKMQSKFALLPFSKIFDWQLKKFIYQGNQEPDILIEVKVAGRLPQIADSEDIFVAHHHQDNTENWRLNKDGRGYIYRFTPPEKEQLARVNRDFNNIVIHLSERKNVQNRYTKNAEEISENLQRKALLKKENGLIWSPGDIIYDFLQILLLQYLAKRKEGIFVHAMGANNSRNKAFIFAGRSGCGKTTLAKLWHKNPPKGEVLNDERVIIKKKNKNFMIYASPWHGEFDEYFNSNIDVALLDKIFFISHAPRNVMRKIPSKEAFLKLYQTILPVHWNKKCLNNIIYFCQDLVKNIPCYDLGFVNNEKVIDFVEK